MANVNHSSLTDPYLHEPKGASTATAGEVYVADGVGSGTWTQNHRHVGGHLTFSTSTPYAHSTTTTDTVLNPTFTLVDNNGFSGVASPNARIQYDGAEDISAALTGTFSFQQASGTSRQVELAFYKNGVALAGSRVIATAVSGEWHQITVAFNTTLSVNDYIEVFTKADAAATINYASGYLRITGVPS
jgi:hypothetical protein